MDGIVEDWLKDILTKVLYLINFVSYVCWLIDWLINWLIDSSPLSPRSTCGRRSINDFANCTVWRRTCLCDLCTSSRVWQRWRRHWSGYYMGATRSSSGWRRFYRSSSLRRSIRSTSSKYSPWRCGKLVLGLRRCLIVTEMMSLLDLILLQWKHLKRS